MNLSQEQFETIVDAFQEAGYEVHPYSGRCMYGAQCLGVDCDNPIRVVLKVVSALAENNEGSDLCELISLLEGAKTDSMGRGSILYFHDIEWSKENLPEEFDTDDDGGFRSTGELDYAPSSGREDFCRGT
jgi:hypothetical protein